MFGQPYALALYGRPYVVALNSMAAQNLADFAHFRYNPYCARK